MTPIITQEEPTSGFVRPDDVIRTDRFTDFSPLSGSGYSLLVRAKRNGRWWLLKGLKEQYRKDTVYQVLLQEEYEITSRLLHPMVVSVFSLEEVEGLGPCIVMEWVDGMTLKEWLAQGGHTKAQRRHVVDMMLDALAYVHSRQTQHRDLKPSNIMLTNDGLHLKLIDFGLSDTDSHAILKPPAGTEGYMAPDGPSDVYSLGCILRELRLGWLSNLVIRKCCASLPRRYTNFADIRRDLHRCWQWPRRVFLLVILALLVAGLYLLSHSPAQQGMQTVNDSLSVLKEEDTTRSDVEQEKADTPQIQVKQIYVKQEQEEMGPRDSARNHLDEAKRQIDQQVQSYGIQQMLDTVSCQLNISIPFLRILDEMILETEEPELKEYIDERYRKPWMKRMKELPFD